MPPIKYLHTHLSASFCKSWMPKKVNGARMHRHIVNKKIDYRVLQSKTRL